MPATSLIGLGVWTLDKTTFQNESTFQMTLYLARTMLADKLITEKEYRDFKKEIIKRYEPFFGDLYT